MLETMRRHSRSLVIYLVFGILIVVFIISFGPQSVGSRRGIRGGGSGCGNSTPAAAMVRGQEISENSWRYGILAYGHGGASGERARRMQVRERVLDQLIVRELLAQKAEDMGLRISDAEVRDRLTSGDIVILGTKLDGKRQYFMRDEGDETPRFMAKGLDAFAKNLGLGSVDRFIDEQRRELLAAKVRDLVTASVRVSPEEVQQRYQLENSKASVEYVQFAVGPAKQAIELSPAEIDAYVKAHEEDLKAQFEKEADRWKGRDKEVRVRDLFVKTERPAPATQPAGPETQPAAPPKAPDPARAKAEAALAKIKGGQDFAAVVKAMNPDAARGGDLGWRPVRGLRLGAPVAEAVEKMAKGAVSDVIEVPDGYHIVQLIDKREGDIKFDDVKRDLAEDALLDERAKATAKAGAEKALAAVKAGTPLDKQFPGEEAKDVKGPRLLKATDFGRAGGFIPGIGSSAELVRALFDEIKVGDVLPKAYEVGGDFFVIRLVKRDEPDMEKFQTEKPKLAGQMAREKGEVTLTDFAAGVCRAAKDKGEISFDPELVVYSEMDLQKLSSKKRPTYQVCSTLR
jgi:peptidyl-prolyl cis-trans isomerase D